MRHRVTKTLITGTLTALVLFVRPAPARADLTAFFGMTPTTSVRETRGFAVGYNITLVGGEFEWARTSEHTADFAPGVETKMFNGMIIAPGRKVKVYLSAGWGRYTETLGATAHTGSASNFGVGAKIRLAGPIYARVDYRSFSLSDTLFVKNPKRFYGGLTLGF